MVKEEDPWEWGVGGIVDPNPAPEEQIPALTAVATLLLIQRIQQNLKAPKKVKFPNKKLQDRVKERSKAKRLAQLFEEKLVEVRESVASMPSEGQIEVPRLVNELRSMVHKRLPEMLCLNLLISAWATDPLAPFEVKISDKVLEAAMDSFAQDLGVPRSWAKEAKTAIDAATKAQEPNRIAGIAITILGVSAMIAAAPLVLAAAPATLTGGAVIMAGLAALGPGGMMGGLAIVTTLAGVGGVAATAGAFVAGSPQQVTENVTALHATALAKSEIRPGHAPRKELRLLFTMGKQLEQQMETHNRIDDKPSKTLAAVKKKLSSVRKAYRQLENQPELQKIWDEFEEREKS